MRLPGDSRRAEQLIAIREAVPAGVNQRVGRAQRDIDPRIAKTAADMIVPFDRFGEMMRIYREGFATRGLESQDLRIANQVIEEGRVLIIALNKWDVAEHASSLFNGVKAALSEGLAQLKDVALLTVSGKTGKGIDTVIDVAFDLRDAWARRVPTGELNRWFEAAVEANPPPAPRGQRIKLRYITQVKSRPPTFVVFGNRTDELPESYRRYLVNAMRRDLKLGPIPLRLEFRGRANPFDRGRR